MKQQKKKLETENKALQASQAREKQLWIVLILTWAIIGLWHAMMYRT
jgi:hypothetical protein